MGKDLVTIKILVMSEKSNLNDYVLSVKYNTSMLSKQYSGQIYDWNETKCLVGQYVLYNILEVYQKILNGIGSNSLLDFSIFSTVRETSCNTNDKKKDHCLFISAIWFFSFSYITTIHVTQMI